MFSECITNLAVVRWMLKSGTSRFPNPGDVPLTQLSQTEADAPNCTGSVPTHHGLGRVTAVAWSSVEYSRLLVVGSLVCAIMAQRLQWCDMPKGDKVPPSRHRPLLRPRTRPRARQSLLFTSQFMAAQVSSGSWSGQAHIVRPVAVSPCAPLRCHYTSQQV